MSSRVDPRAPCIVGVAAHTWHPHDVGEQGAPEPLAMWEEVARLAALDSTRPALLEQLDSLQIVYCQTCQYDDPVERLAARLHAEPAHRHYSGIGGTTTQQLVNATAERARIDAVTIPNPSVRRAVCTTPPSFWRDATVSARLPGQPTLRLWLMASPRPARLHPSPQPAPAGP